MYLFMFFLLPLMLSAWCFYKKDTRFVPVIFIGIITAVLVCGFRAFFLYSHRIIPFSFGSNTLYLLMRQTFLPVVLVYGLFFLWSKDTLSFKIDSFVPLLSSFYALYLPYNIISTSEHIYTIFPLFEKPVIYAAMVVSISFFLHCSEKSFNNKKYVFAGLWIAAGIVSLVIPALLEAMYILDMSCALVLLLSIIYCGLIPVLFLLKRFRILK